MGAIFMRDRQTEIALYGAMYQSPDYRMGFARYRALVGIFARLPKGSLLDVATGRGEALEVAAACGHYPVFGSEVVTELLSEQVTYAEAHALPFADGTFDHVTCFDCVEHLLEADILPALRELYRVARVSVSVSASELSDLRDGRELHISRRPTAEWLKVIREAWGDGAQQVGTAGMSPLFQVFKPCAQ